MDQRPKLPHHLTPQFPPTSCFFRLSLRYRSIYTLIFLKITGRKEPDASGTSSKSGVNPPPRRTGKRYARLTNVRIYSFNLTNTNAKRGRLIKCLGTGFNASIG